MTATAEHHPVDPATRKTVLRMFTYGLYALGTARGDDRDLATVNWATQVSFDPALLAISVQNDSHSIEILRDTGACALSIFGEDQREQAGLLGKRWRLRPDKVEAVVHRPGAMTGCPILENSLGAVECRVRGSMPAGDSTVFLVEPLSAEVFREGTPLTMAAAGFRHAG